MKKKSTAQYPFVPLAFFKHEELIHQMLHIYPVLRLLDIRTTFCFCFASYSQETYTLY